MAGACLGGRLIKGPKPAAWQGIAPKSLEMAKEIGDKARFEEITPKVKKG